MSYLSIITKTETKLLKPISRKTLAEQVLAILKRFILIENLQEGDMLPSERRLAANFGVSYRVIREAMSLLAGEGIVGKQQGLGVFVRAFDRNRLQDGELVLFPSSFSKADIYALRVAIEMGAICFATEYATDEDLTELQKMAELRAPEVEQGMMACDIHFHLTILKATHNELFQQFDQLIAEAIRLKAYDRNRLLVPRPLQVTIAEHQAIVDALRKRDAARATVEMYNHMESVRDLVRREKKLSGEHSPEEALRALEKQRVIH